MAPHRSNCCWFSPVMETVGKTTPLVPTWSPAMVTASDGLIVGTVSTPDMRTLNSCASAEMSSAGSLPTDVGWN